MSQETAEEIAQQDQPITLATFQKEVVSLEQEFRGLLSALKDADQDLTSSNLEHILLLDSAAEATQEAADKAVIEGEKLIQRCLALNKELRGTDKLAERVKQLKRHMDVLEQTVDSLLMN